MQALAFDNTVVYGLVTASTTMAGGMWLASRPREWLTHERLAALMAIGGGLLLAVLFFELLPASIQHGGPQALSWAFGGLIAVLCFERYLAPHLTFLDPKPESPDACGHAHGHDHDGHVRDHGHAHAHDHTHGAGALLSHSAACSALGCLLVCTFFDGVAMAAGFALDFQIGLLIMIGLLAHILPEGMLAATVVLAAGSSSKHAQRAAIATGVAFLLGMGVPLLIGGATGTLGIALPIASGVLLYVVIAQIVPIALRSASGVPLVMAGALVFGIVEKLLPHSH